MKPDIHVISHCWAGQLVQYAQALVYQLSTIVNNPPAVNTRFTICFTPTDYYTMAVLKFFSDVRVSNLEWDFHSMEKRNLMRRAIGRNEVGKASDARVIWFTDVDYLIKGLSLSDASELCGKQFDLVHPFEIQRSKTHEHGDRMLQDVDPLHPRVLKLRGDSFKASRMPRAIGGVQIVSGDVVRKHGFCDGIKRWMRPANTWQQCKCDRAARGAWGLGQGAPVGIRGVFRLRHSKVAYDK